MPVPIQQMSQLSDDELCAIAMADPGAYPDDSALAAWEQLAARGVIVELAGQPQAAADEAPEDLVTIATFRSYIEAQFAQTRLLASGIQAFLFDDNAVRINWLWSTALGGVKLLVPAADLADALAILAPTADCAS